MHDLPPQNCGQIWRMTIGALKWCAPLTLSSSHGLAAKPPTRPSVGGYTRLLSASGLRESSLVHGAKVFGPSSQAANCKQRVMQIMQPSDEARSNLQVVLRPPPSGFVGLKIWRPS